MAEQTGADDGKAAARRRVALSDVPAILAIGAVGLYVLGIIATVGKLNASHVDLGQALARIPLEVHLRNGIGLLASPVVVSLIPTFIAGAMFPFVAGGLFPDLIPNADGAVETESDEPNADARVSRRQIENVVIVIVVPLVCGSVLSIAWPEGLALAILAFLLLLTFVPQRFGLTRFAAVLLAFAGGIALLVVMTLLYSAPLPNARLTTASGGLFTEPTVINAPVISTDGNMIYLAPTHPNEKRLYAAIPASQVRSMQVTRVERARDKSVLELLGL